MDKLYIGIDPGVKTGFAVWDPKNKTFQKIATMSIVEAILTACELEEKLKNKSMHFFIEDARQCKFPGSHGAQFMQGVGSVKRDCTIWQDLCEDMSWKYELINPMRHKYKKMSADDFKALTGYDNRTSSHARDAAMLVWGMG